ncbi:MAG: hypothetical protein WC444_04760 [Candidatus Paceibacterota bacterium]
MSRKIDLCDGKYTIIIPDNWGKEKFECLRYGESWRDLTGDKMVAALCEEIIELQESIKSGCKTHVIEIEACNTALKYESEKWAEWEAKARLLAMQAAELAYDAYGADANPEYWLDWVEMVINACDSINKFLVWAVAKE